KTSIFSHPVYLFLREFSLQDFRGGSDLFPAQLLGMLPNLEYIAKISGGTIVKGRLPILTQ
ncbi:hypothetical protein C9161_27800, partial (plasmid) [Escherichia coli]